MPDILVLNSNISIETKENHLKCFECFKSIIIQILMLTLMLGFPNITPIADDAEITYIDLMSRNHGGERII